MQSPLQNGEKITPKNWKVDKLSQGLSLEFAYAKVSYNRKNLEGELQNESRQIAHRTQIQFIQNKKRNDVEL